MLFAALERLLLQVISGIDVTHDALRLTCLSINGLLLGVAEDVTDDFVLELDRCIIKPAFKRRLEFALCHVPADLEQRQQVILQQVTHGRDLIVSLARCHFGLEHLSGQHFSVRGFLFLNGLLVAVAPGQDDIVALVIYWWMLPVEDVRLNLLLVLADMDNLLADFFVVVLSWSFDVYDDRPVVRLDFDLFEIRSTFILGFDSRFNSLNEGGRDLEDAFDVVGVYVDAIRVPSQDAAFLAVFAVCSIYLGRKRIVRVQLEKFVMRRRCHREASWSARWDWRKTL